MSSKQVGIFQENLMGGNYNTFTMPRTHISGWLDFTLVARTDCHLSGAHIGEDEKIGDLGMGVPQRFVREIQCEGTIMNHWMMHGEPYMSTQSCPKCITCVFQHFGDQYRSTRLRKITHVFARDMVVSGPFLHNKNTCEKKTGQPLDWLFFSQTKPIISYNLATGCYYTIVVCSTPS